MSGRDQLSSTVQKACLVLLALAFGWSGLNKMIDPSGFSLAVFRYHILPYAAVNMVSLWIAGLELLCAVLLFVRPWRTAALWMLACLLLVFSIGIGIHLARGSHMACGCFSTSPMAHTTGWLGLLKNAGLMTAVIFALAHPTQRCRNAAR